MNRRIVGVMLAVVSLAAGVDANGAAFEPIDGAFTAGGNLTAGNGSAFFFGYTPEGGTKQQPWVTDGTAAGTHAAKTILGSSGAVSLGQRHFTWKGIWYFTADDGFAGYQLWRSDGTDTGTFALTGFSNLSSSSSFDMMDSLTGFGDLVIFNAELPSTVQLMASDGTLAGTHVIANNTLTYTDGPGAIINGRVMFGGSATRFIFTDGTAAGTSVVSYSGVSGLSQIGGAVRSSLTAVNDVVYFVGGDATHGLELWRTDGTTAGTTMVKDIFGGTTGSNPDHLTRVDDRLFFVAVSDTNTGRELWTSDGSAAGTVQVKDIYPNIQNSMIDNTVAMLGKLYFTATDGTHGKELWVSDGTAAGTKLALGDFNTQPNVGAFDGTDATLQTENDKLLLMMKGDGDPHAVDYQSDGTLAGTARIDPDDNDAIHSQQFFDTFALANGSIFAVESSQVVKADAFATLGDLWCSSVEENIPDASPIGASSSVHLPAYGRISDLKVSVDIGHPYIGDLTVALVHEQTGKQVTLFDQPAGRCDGALMNITFDDKAATAADDNCSSDRPAYPLRASYKPLQRLSAMNGQTLAGDWTLHVIDNASVDVGTLHRWCMRFQNDSIFADDFE